MVYLSFTSFPKYGVTNFLTNGHFSAIYVNSVDVYFYFLKPSHKFKTFARHFLRNDERWTCYRVIHDTADHVFLLALEKWLSQCSRGFHAYNGFKSITWW